MLPDQVLALVARALPGQPIGDVAPTEGGFSHHTALATIGGRRCLIKAAATPNKRADVRHEATMLALLRGQGLLAPAPVALAEGDGWTVAISAAIAGSSGIQLYRRPELLGQAYAELGALLARVHRAPIAPASPDQMLAERFGQVRRQLPTLGLPPELLDVFAASLAHPAWQPPAARLTHGDAGLHNTLCEQQITALLDWEWAGWGNPLLDLAWVYWTMRWRAVAPELWPIFLRSYQAAAGAEPAGMEALRALALGQIAGIIVRVHDQPAARAEWLRRAAWTLELEFPDSPDR
jgi:aminoglycoside phosphotransferase (APT) family kinase protein